MIEVKNLSYSYGRGDVLSDINLFVSKGEITFILGPNGSGKSTLLKCLNRILKPKGCVLIEGKDLSELSPMEIAKIIGYVPQKSEIANLTVFDTILLGRKPYMKWKPTEEDYKIVEKIIKDLGLEELSVRKLTELSGGELQKVIIARALAQQPKILLLDEPTNNLDLKNQIEILKLVKGIVRERGISAVITTHDLNVATSFADKVILMKNGRILACGGVEIINEKNVKEIYGVDVSVVRVNGTSLIVPLT